VKLNIMKLTDEAAYYSHRMKDANMRFQDKINNLKNVLAIKESEIDFLHKQLDIAFHKGNMKEYEVAQLKADMEQVQKHNETMSVNLQKALLQNHSLQQTVTVLKAEMQNVFNSYMMSINTGVHERMAVMNQLQKYQAALSSMTVAQKADAPSSSRRCGVCLTNERDACLSCGHMFCEQCVKSIADGDEGCKCPMCRSVSNMPDGKPYVKVFEPL
jgi:hypothetical protein